MKKHLSPKSMTPCNIPALSEDGYVRLRFSGLESIHLIHLVSGLDEDPPETVFSGAISTAITGYTEWISDTTPTITIGWDWEMGMNPIALKRTGEPRGNIMLADARMADLGPTKTAALLELFVDTLPWQIEVIDYIEIRYT